MRNEYSGEFKIYTDSEEAMGIMDSGKAAATSDAALRKMQPVGVIVTKYFPKALRGVSAVGWVGNEKHNPGTEPHWERGKSNDHVNCCTRHLQDAAEGDGWDTVELPDGRIYQVRHSAAAAWRALALAELDIEANGGEVIRVIRGTPSK